MNNPESVKIIIRFFTVLDLLISTKVIRGIKTYTDRYEINRRHLYLVRDNPERDIFQMSWLTPMINEFGVSAQWLMTGKGEMFVKDKFTKVGSPSQS